MDGCNSCNRWKQKHDHMFAEARRQKEASDKRIVELEAKVEQLKDPDGRTYIALTKQWLTHYPADIFDGSSGDPGTLFVVAVRNALAALEQNNEDT